MNRTGHLATLALALALALAPALTLLTACSDTPRCTPPPPIEHHCQTAATPDEAVQVFREAYAGRDTACFAELLHDEFLFIPQDADPYDRDTELTIARAMFNGLEGHNNIIISDITVDQLIPHSVWQPAPIDDPHFADHPDSQYRQYLVDFRFHVSGQNLILRVQGPVLFYTLDHGGQNDPDVRILGMVDTTFGNKATQVSTWSDVRALFQ